MTQVYKGYPLWFWSAIVFGILLRIASICWNDRLLGDVNLFALTAREYAESGELNYPMKYDFSEKTSWGSLKSPQSQHPPLWSFVAGSLADILGTKNTYGILQVMSLFAQILLLYITFKLGSFFRERMCHLYPSHGRTLSLANRFCWQWKSIHHGGSSHAGFLLFTYGKGGGGFVEILLLWSVVWLSLLHTWSICADHRSGNTCICFKQGK